MHYLGILLGFFCLVLVNSSVTLNKTLQITQKPRFYGVKTGRNVVIYCVSSYHTQHTLVEWHRASQYNVTFEKRERLLAGGNVIIKEKTKTRNGSISLRNLGTSDSGVYFCKLNSTWGPGTELQVVIPSLPGNALHKSQMKDGLIFFQGLILMVLVVVPLIRKQTLLKKEEAIYEEPKNDHIYKGLEIERCDDRLYEDLSLYAQPGAAEAAWEQD